MLHSRVFNFSILLVFLIQETSVIITTNRTVKVKISGDGARITRLTRFVPLSFGILDHTDVIISSKDIALNRA